MFQEMNVPNEKFQSFLTDVNSRATETKRQARLQGWIGQVSALYAEVAALLNEYVEGRELTLVREPRHLVEEGLGPYTLDALAISIGKQRVVMEPIGAHVIGAYGRVDMKGPFGFRRLVLVPTEEKKPNITVRISTDAQTSDSARQRTPNPELSWKFATPAPKIEYVDLDQDSLTTSIMELLGA